MKNHVPTKFGLTVLAIALSGCAGFKFQTPQAPPQPTEVSLSYQMPTLTPVEPSKQDQRKNEVRISVAPFDYETHVKSRREFMLVPTFLIQNDQHPAKMRILPTEVEVTPRELRFRVTIHNHMEHPLKLTGAVVSFQVGGQTANVPEAGYEDFLNGIILHEQQGDYVVNGPALRDLPDSATIAFSLDEIVTETNDAGDPTKRSNFEFYYKFTRQDTSQVEPIENSDVMLNSPQVQMLNQQTGGAEFSWGVLP